MLERDRQPAPVRNHAHFAQVSARPPDSHRDSARGPYDLAPDSILTYWYVVIASPCSLDSLAIRCKEAVDIYEERLAGIAETMDGERVTIAPEATIVRGVLFLPPSLLSPRSFLLSIDGRKVLNLRPGANDVSRLSPGVYFVRQASGVERAASSVTKVVLTD